MTTNNHDILITRLFDAPRELVWKAWTTREILLKWLAPKGCSCTFCSVDFRVGGKFHFCMRVPEGRDVWVLGVYREIVEPERIVYLETFSNADGNIVSPAHYGMSASRPPESTVTITFEEQDGKTMLTLLHTITDTVEEFTSQKQGWTDVLDQLAVVLGKK